MVVPGGERERGRETETETETEREGERETETKRERERQTDRQTDRHRHRQRQIPTQNLYTQGQWDRIHLCLSNSYSFAVHKHKTILMDISTTLRLKSINRQSFNAVAYRYAYLQKHQNRISFMEIYTTLILGKHATERAKVNSAYLHT